MWSCVAPRAGAWIEQSLLLGKVRGSGCVTVAAGPEAWALGESVFTFWGKKMQKKGIKKTSEKSKQKIRMRPSERNCFLMIDLPEVSYGTTQKDKDVLPCD